MSGMPTLTPGLVVLAVVVVGGFCPPAAPDKAAQQRQFPRGSPLPCPPLLAPAFSSAQLHSSQPSFAPLALCFARQPPLLALLCNGPLPACRSAKGGLYT